MNVGAWRLGAISRWADDPGSRTDNQNIVASFVDEQDGSYTFYLYPNLATIGRTLDEEVDATKLEILETPFSWRNFSKNSRANYDLLKSRLGTGPFVLLGMHSPNRVFNDRMVLVNHPARILRRQQVTAADRESEDGPHR